MWDDPHFSASKVMEGVCGGGRVLKALGDDVINRALEIIDIDNDAREEAAYPPWLRLL